MIRISCSKYIEKTRLYIDKNNYKEARNEVHKTNTRF